MVGDIKTTTIKINNYIYIMLNYIATIVIITTLGILFERFKLRYIADDELKHSELIKNFLLNDNLENKPILWIHSSHNINSRMWKSFGSRNTENINQPYLNLCVKSVIKNCGNNFRIALIDDLTFNKILPNWKIKLSNLSEPIRDHVRKLALCKLLNSYGGFLIPDSTVVLQNLYETYSDGINSKGFFIGKQQSKSVENSYTSPNSNFMGCTKNNLTMKKIIGELEVLMSKNYTNEIEFSGLIDNIFMKYIKQENIKYLHCKVTGLEDINSKLVTLDRLMGATFIDFNKDTNCIVFPKDELLARKQYQWFARLSEDQLYSCNNSIAKWIIIALKGCK
tara:strand:- start:969 stop:1979 length:1011 start_codon:yes stop_codon:yes gene_type:complete